jgi:eukaryotic-like serine/threonine-protein kinase
VTNPQDPYGYDPYSYDSYSYDPLGRVPFEDPLVGPPLVTPPPAPPRRPPVNALATLSLVFAFVFPPAGAILGHLGLAQIRRTSELGRGRALAGLALSYAFITLTVVALVGWAVLGAFTSRSSQTAEPGTTSSTSTGPPPPTVAPDTVGTLLPSLTDLKTIVDDQNLEAGPTWAHPGRSDNKRSVDRAECWGSISPGTPEAYDVDAILGYHAAGFSDTHTFLKSIQVVEAVAAFRDPPAARTQLDKLLSGWRKCGGSVVNVTIPGVGPTPYSLSAPADAGNGITTLDLAPKGLQVRATRAIAARANVVIDVSVSASGTTDRARARQSAVSIANYLLNKIPG